MNIAAKVPPAVVAVDLDNLVVSKRGFDRIDIARFMNRVAHDLGRNCVVKVFANGMSVAAEAIWHKFGAEVVRTGVNADPFIEDFLFGADDAQEVLIVSGDHCFANVARWHASLKHRTGLWSLRGRTSTKLMQAVDRIEWIDDLIIHRRTAFAA